jgi:hypothetical protein
MRLKQEERARIGKAERECARNLDGSSATAGNDSSAGRMTSANMAHIQKVEFVTEAKFLTFGTIEMRKCRSVF